MPRTAATGRLVRRLRYAFDWLRLAVSRAHIGAGFHRLMAITTEPQAPSFKLIGDPDSPHRIPSFPAETSPLITIVIPVYGQCDSTMQCLRSLARTATDYRFEVVVVDDGSKDATAAAVGECANVRLHQMPSNQGFVAACNAGAAMARGGYLVFLNNDTEVTDGWMDALMRCFQTIQNCGLVGAKLVYPNGTLQEAGGIVFNDAQAWNYGRGCHPDATRFDYIREVDYCSAACIALPRSLFMSLGGFDDRYAPAYYEDTDLAFAVRHAGYEVVYQPRARIIHHEGKTAGTHVGRGVKRFQEVNRDKFVKKWKDVLADQPTIKSLRRSPERCVTHRRKARLLVVGAYFPKPDQDSGSLRMFEILRLLRDLGYHVIYWAEGESRRDHYARALEEHGVELVIAPSRLGALRWWRDNGADLDLIVLSRLPIAKHNLRYARRYAQQAAVIFDTVDLHFLRVSRGAMLRKDPVETLHAERLRRTELDLVRKADLTLAVSDHERNMLHTLVPGARIEVLSNIHNIREHVPSFESREGLLFLGSFEHEPNVDAVHFLVDEIMPHLRVRLPDVVLHIVGHASERTVGKFAAADIVVHGHVPDLASIFDTVRVAVAPLRYGAGVKGKINMAMSHGVPVVTTSIGAEGMGLTDGKDAMIADDGKTFADAVCRLHSNHGQWVSFSRRGAESVARNFSATTARSTLLRMLATFGY